MTLFLRNIRQYCQNNRIFNYFLVTKHTIIMTLKDNNAQQTELNIIKIKEESRN